VRFVHKKRKKKQRAHLPAKGRWVWRDLISAEELIASEVGDAQKPPG
jgi:hypothetical protein